MSLNPFSIGAVLQHKQASNQAPQPVNLEQATQPVAYRSHSGIKLFLRGAKPVHCKPAAQALDGALCLLALACESIRELEHESPADMATLDAIDLSLVDIARKLSAIVRKLRDDNDSAALASIFGACGYSAKQR